MEVEETHPNMSLMKESTLASLSPLIICFVHALTYVLSLYVWKSNLDRNDPTLIKKRFISVAVMIILSPLFLYISLRKETLAKASFLELLGIRLPGLFLSALVALLLTVVLFFGPIVLQICSRGASKFDISKWRTQLQDLIFWRNIIVAPFSEELSFRACMYPAILQIFKPEITVFICPLYFGVAHFHHFYEMVSTGGNLKVALGITSFQFLYTTVFGAYSAFLLGRTGHLAACYVAHAFCNTMGFPDLTKLNDCQDCHKVLVLVCFVIGLASFCSLVIPLTDPSIYNNDFLWKKLS